MLQHRLSGFAKLTDHATGRLDSLATVMQFSEICDCRVTNSPRHASPGIVGKPVSVIRPDQVIAGNHDAAPIGRETASDEAT